MPSVLCLCCLGHSRAHSSLAAWSPSNKLISLNGIQWKDCNPKIHRNSPFPFISLLSDTVSVWQRKTPFLPLLYPYFFFFQLHWYFASWEYWELIILIVKLLVVEIMTLEIRCELVLTLHMILKSFYCITYLSNPVLWIFFFFWKVPCFLSKEVFLYCLVFICVPSDVRCPFSSIVPQIL